MEGNEHNATYNTLFHWNSFKFKLIIEGIVTGLVVVLYRYLLEDSLTVVNKIYVLLSQKY
jgi:hypothetical protein